MKKINLHLIILVITSLILFGFGLGIISVKKQLAQIEEELEHVGKKIDEAVSGVKRLTAQESLKINLRKNGLLEQQKAEIDRIEHDFGQIKKEDGAVITDFIIKNSGEDVLAIGDITTSCGCTSAKANKNEILSGESAIIKVSFDPNFHEESKGRFSRSVFIPTNDPNNREIEFKIFVEIKD